MSTRCVQSWFLCELFFAFVLSLFASPYTPYAKYDSEQIILRSFSIVAALVLLNVYILGHYACHGVLINEPLADTTIIGEHLAEITFHSFPFGRNGMQTEIDIYLHMYPSASSVKASHTE